MSRAVRSSRSPSSSFPLRPLAAATLFALAAGGAWAQGEGSPGDPPPLMTRPEAPRPSALPPRPAPMPAPVPAPVPPPMPVPVQQAEPAPMLSQPEAPRPAPVESASPASVVLQFEARQAVLRGESDERWRTFLQQVRRTPEATVVIRTGGRDAARAKDATTLAQRRAERLRMDMLVLGIPSTAVVVQPPRAGLPACEPATACKGDGATAQVHLVPRAK